MAANWAEIKSDYLSGGGSYRSLAKKYGVSFGAIRDHALKEGWTAQKTAQEEKLVSKTAQLTLEKTAQAISDEAASKAKIRAKIFKLAEEWFDDQKKIKDTADFRRMVQTLLDMGIVDQKGQDEEGAESGVAMLPPIMDNPGPPEDDANGNNRAPSEAQRQRVRRGEDERRNERVFPLAGRREI